jgi:ketosteroid isomerase-like protein
MKMSRIEQGLRATLAFYEAFNQHDVAAMMKQFGDDCLLEAADPPPDGDLMVGKTAVAVFWHDFLESHLDVRVDIEHIVGLGNHCVARWQLSFLDENGRARHMRGADSFFIQGNLISEQRTYIKGYY